MCRAWQVADQVLQMSPADAGSYALLGQAWHGIGDVHRAHQSFVQSLHLDPTNPQVKEGVESMRQLINRMFLGV